jgi:hypothetical protein
MKNAVFAGYKHKINRIRNKQQAHGVAQDVEYTRSRMVISERQKIKKHQAQARHKEELLRDRHGRGDGEWRYFAACCQLLHNQISPPRGRAPLA